MSLGDLPDKDLRKQRQEINRELQKRKRVREEESAKDRKFYS